MEIAILITLIFLNGIFAMSEIALVTARKSRLQRLAEEGDRSAAVAIQLGQEPTRFLSTVQIGITAIGILNGIVGEAALAGPLAKLLSGFGLAPKSSAIAATTIVVVTITYLTIVLGELVPKRLAQFNAEGIARMMARPIAILAQLSRPFVYLLSKSTDIILKLLGKKDLNSASLTEEDIRAILKESSQAGIIEEKEHEMLRNVFRLDDRQIASLMTPRSEIVFLDIEQQFQKNLEMLAYSDHSRLPVCRGGMYNLLGVITAQELLKQHLRGELTEHITDHLLPAVYVPESLSGMKLLEQFRESDIQMVFVVDEYGQILGLITLQDILEALTGQFKPDDREDVWAVQRKDGSWLIDGLIPVPELKDLLELKSVPEEKKKRYHTLSGMMMCLFGGVPHSGNVAEWQGWRLEIVDLDGNRVDKVMASRLPEADTNGANGSDEADNS
ncbi:hemolysin family protein [Desulfosediminicola ganghwensis]|uniref:hemolysin family protein n=1 Tax=Desulfosediminicola ganghwensis TaxID=2569540 RepID=UPI0010ACA548|nr:hemolysin family protein [Desulfosediminicola ganghwensis]